MIIESLEVSIANVSEIFVIGKNGVTKIEDHSVDAEQNYLAKYIVYIDGIMKYAFENCAFAIGFGE